MVAFGLLVCWSNAIGGIVLAQLQEIGWTNTSITAIFTSLTTAGMFAGALFGGMIGDKIGRRNSVLLFETIHIIAMITAAFSPNMNFLIAVRVVMGFGLGALLVTLFAGYTEYMPGRNRGTWSSRVSFIGNWSYPIASTIALSITPLLAVGMSWRVQFVIPAVLSIIATLIAYKKFPESPRWLEAQGRFEEAEKIMSEIEMKVEKQTGKKLPPIVEEVEAKQAKMLPYTALLKGALLKRVILGSFVLIAMNVVQYTLINWLPSIFLAQGINLKDSIVLNTMSMFGAPFGIFIAMLIMDRIPRKVLGVSLLLTIATLGYVYSLQESMFMISLLGFFLITFVYMFVCFASAVYVPEIWPTEAKLRGSGLANAMGRISGIAAPFAVAALLESSGVTGVFVLLGSVAVIVAIVIATIGIETRGASIEDIGQGSDVAKGA